MSYSPFIEPKKSQFGEARISEPTQQINLKSNYGISSLRDIVTTNASGTVTSDFTEYKLATTANGADLASLASSERGRYIAGQDAEVGLGIRVTDTPSGNQIARWGYFDTDNGFGFGVDAGGLFVFDRKNTVETKTVRSNWNGDKLDGTGPSGYTIDLSKGYIFQVNFAWYGYGTIEFNIVVFDEVTKKQKMATVHRIRKTNQTSISNPNLPINIEVSNGGTATAFDGLYVGGRQFSTIGKFIPARRITSERRIGMTGVSTTIIPIISFRRKGAFESVSVKTQGFDIITDQPILVEIRTGGTLTGASFIDLTNTTAAETAVESDKSSTAITGGDLIWSGIVNASGSGGNSSGSLQVILTDQDFIGLTPISICATRIGGTNATVSCVFRILEEW